MSSFTIHSSGVFSLSRSSLQSLRHESRRYRSRIHLRCYPAILFLQAISSVSSTCAYPYPDYQRLSRQVHHAGLPTRSTIGSCQAPSPHTGWRWSIVIFCFLLCCDGSSKKRAPGSYWICRSSRSCKVSDSYNSRHVAAFFSRILSSTVRLLSLSFSLFL